MEQDYGDRSYASDVVARCEAEVERIRTDGDMALIKTQAEERHLLSIEEEIQKTRSSIQKARNELLKYTQVPTRAVKVSASNSYRPGQKSNQEERLKTSINEGVSAMQKLRCEIDASRRDLLAVRKEDENVSAQLAAIEKENLDATDELSTLRDRANSLKHEVSDLKKDIDKEKQALKTDQNKLTAELNKIVKADKQQQNTKQSRRLTQLPNGNIIIRKNHRSSGAYSETKDDPAASIEQKRKLLDILTTEAGTTDIHDIIVRHKAQEQAKAELLSCIHAKSEIYEALTEEVAKLEASMTSAEEEQDADSSVRASTASNPQELKRAIAYDEAQRKHWEEQTEGFNSILKALQDPVKKLYFALDSDTEWIDESVDSLNPADRILRFLGEIEERAMRCMWSKAMSESNDAPESPTLHRLLQQQQHFTSLQDTANTNLSMIAPPLLDDSDEDSVDLAITSDYKIYHSDHSKVDIPKSHDNTRDAPAPKPRKKVVHSLDDHRLK